MSVKHFQQPQPIVIQPDPFTARIGKAWRPATQESEVFVPLLLAVVSGSLAAGLYLWAWWEIDALHLSVECVPFIFLVTAIVVWVWRIRKHDEMLLASDLQAQVAQETQLMPEPSVRVDVTLHRSDRNTPQLLRFDLPCNEETLYEVADALLHGSNLNESDWAGLNQGRPFSEVSLSKFKRALVAYNLAEWVDPKNVRLGMKLTDEGRQFFEQVIDNGQSGE